MKTRTPARTPAKPRGPFPKPEVADDFPLTWHKHRGHWFKKYKGIRYVYSADAAESLERWHKDRDAADKGLETRDAPRRRYTLRDAVNLYLTRQKRRLDLGELGEVQFAKARRELEHHLTRACPLNTPLEAFRARDPADDGPAALFHRIRARAVARGLQVAHRHIVLVRAVLDHAASKRLMLAPTYFDDFDPPSKARLETDRRSRDEKSGDRTWTDDELRTILEAARALREERRAPGPKRNRVRRNFDLYPQILLGLFAAYDSSDCAALPEKAVDLETGIAKFARVKEQNRPRLAILPKPVLEAIGSSLEHRPKRTDAARHLLFVTRDGKPCNVAPRHMDAGGVLERVGRNDTIGQNFKRLLEKLGLKKPRTGFKSLRAACRTLLLRGNIHEDIIAVIMGRKFRYDVDAYYVRGDLREGMEGAAKHLEKILLPGVKRTRSRR